MGCPGAVAAARSLCSCYRVKEKESTNGIGNAKLRSESIWLVMVTDSGSSREEEEFLVTF